MYAPWDRLADFITYIFILMQDFLEPILWDHESVHGKAFAKRDAVFCKYFSLRASFPLSLAAQCVSAGIIS